MRKSKTNEQQESSTVQEKIRARGERAIDYTKVIETSLCAEWNLNADTQKFSARSALIRLLRKMAAVDDIQIVSPATGDKWADFEKLPSGDDFIQAFNIQQSHPKKGPSCITAFFHLISTTMQSN